MAMEQDLVKEFSSNGFLLDDPDVAKKCASLCASFDLSPSDLVSKWELFYLNLCLEGGRVSSNHLDNFRQFMENEQREAFRRKRTDFHIYSKDDVDMLLQETEDLEFQSTPAKCNNRSGNNGSRMEMDDGFLLPKTPTSLPRSCGKHKSCTESPATPFNQRSNKLKVQFVLNKELPETFSSNRLETVSEDGDIIKRLRPIERLDFQILSDGPRPGCRYMFDRTEKRFNAIEQKIKGLASALAEDQGVPVHNQVFVASQDRTFVIGMVCCDGEGHLNENSVLLQGSAEYSNGHRVRLDLSSIERFSLFPGQIIGVEGHNPSGHCLVVTRLVDSIPINVHDGNFGAEVPHAKRQATDTSIPTSTDNSSSNLPMSMIVAAGPFTTSDNLEYEPLVELLDYARKKQPNLILLMGPFVDSEHPQIKLGTVDRTFHQIFEEEIKIRIEDYCEEMGGGARVLLVPSTRDAHHDFIFPQPAFEGANFADPEHVVSMLGNPCLFSLNKLTVGCCTVDVLRHLSSEETARVPVGASTDRLGRLASHIISQHSFYPLFPASAGVPLDLSLSADSLLLSQHTDMLITPSDLSPFVKVLTPSESSFSSAVDAQVNRDSKSTLCINPGRLAKGMYGGTFSDVMIMPFLEEGRDQWPQQARVSIIKL